MLILLTLYIVRISVSEVNRNLVYLFETPNSCSSFDVLDGIAAVARVLGIAELVELMLTQLAAADILHLRQVSRQLYAHVASSRSTLQNKLFLFPTQVGGSCQILESINDIDITTGPRCSFAWHSDGQADRLQPEAVNPLLTSVAPDDCSCLPPVEVDALPQEQRVVHRLRI
jgi:hypothetical protein